MPHVTLADVIIRRVPLSPREAATLTLAVGEEWDRQRALRGPVALPQIGAIQLHDSGDVSFLVTSRPFTGENSGAASLSSLLSRLLGLDEAEPPRQDVPGGLLITIAGRLGSMDLPAATDDGFRTALGRFADDDYSKIVAQVFSRTASARHPAADRSSRERRAAVIPSPDRRRQPQIVTDLRLAIRELEHELFQAREGSGRGDGSGSLRILKGLGAVVIVAAASSLVTLMLWGSEGPARIAPSAVTARDAGAAAGPQNAAETRNGAGTAAKSVRPSSRNVIQRAGRPSPLQPRASRRAGSASTNRPQPQRSRPAAMFPGGTRTIAWMTAPPQRNR